MQCYQTLNLDEQREHHEDIQNFVKGKLRRTGITPFTHTELTEEISRRSSGVFLWAALVVQLLNKRLDGGASRSHLIADLKAVPAGIEQLLKSVLTDGNEFLLPTLLWVLFSLETLKATDLYLAIKIGAGRSTPEDFDQTETTQEQMQLFILESSKGLVEFSKGHYRATAQFIHESVREYLLYGGLTVLDDSLAENLEAKSHLRLAVWCQNYIELDPHHGLCDSGIRQDDFMDYAMDNMYKHYEYAFEGGALQLEFLDTIPQSTQSRIGSQVYRSGSLNLLGLLLDDEQRCSCLVEGLLRRQLRLSGQVDTRSDAIAGVIPYLDVNSSGDAEHNTPLLSAVNLGWVTIVQLLLDCGADPDLESPGYAPLLFALLYQQDDIVELLLRHGANINLVRTYEDGATTPLAVALHRSSTKCVSILLERGADPNLVSPDGLPLLLALDIGDTRDTEDCEWAELLLQHGADPNITSIYNGVTQTPLAMAISQRSTRCVKMLLEHGADANDCRVEIGRPLTDAIETDQQEVVRMLLERDADANGCGATREIGLTAAIRKGRQEVVTMLLQHGADANGGKAELGRPLSGAVSRHPCLEDIVRLLLAHGPDPGGSSCHRPLPAAIRARNEAAVRLLLDAGADPLHAAISTRNEAATAFLLDTGVDFRTRDGRGRSYLHLLCLETPPGDRPWKVNSIAESLLNAGVDINATDESHKTALIMASEMLHFSLLLLLIRRGADVNTNDAANGTPLMMAAKSGALSVVRILLDAGADIDAIDTTRRTALMLAVEMGNFDIARLLVDRGPNLGMDGHKGVVHYLHLRMAEEDAVAGLHGCDRMSE